VKTWLHRGITTTKTKPQKHRSKIDLSNATCAATLWRTARCAATRWGCTYKLTHGLKAHGFNP
jgi:hypothetical protein